MGRGYSVPGRTRRLLWTISGSFGTAIGTVRRLRAFHLHRARSFAIRSIRSSWSGHRQVWDRDSRESWVLSTDASSSRGRRRALGASTMCSAWPTRFRAIRRRKSSCCSAIGSIPIRPSRARESEPTSSSSCADSCHDRSCGRPIASPTSRFSRTGSSARVFRSSRSRRSRPGCPS